MVLQFVFRLSVDYSVDCIYCIDYTDCIQPIKSLSGCNENSADTYDEEEVLMPNIGDFPNPKSEKMFLFNKTSCQMVEYERCSVTEAAEHAPGPTALTGEFEQIYRLHIQRAFVLNNGLSCAKDSWLTRY